VAHYFISVEVVNTAKKRMLRRGNLRNEDNVRIWRTKTNRPIESLIGQDAKIHTGTTNDSSQTHYYKVHTHNYDPTYDDWFWWIFFIGFIFFFLVLIVALAFSPYSWNTHRHWDDDDEGADDDDSLLVEERDIPFAMEVVKGMRDNPEEQKKIKAFNVLKHDPMDSQNPTLSKKKLKQPIKITRTSSHVKGFSCPSGTSPSLGGEYAYLSTSACLPNYPIPTAIDGSIVEKTKNECTSLYQHACSKWDGIGMRSFTYSSAINSKISKMVQNLDGIGTKFMWNPGSDEIATGENSESLSIERQVFSKFTQSCFNSRGQAETIEEVPKSEMIDAFIHTLMKDVEDEDWASLGKYFGFASCVGVNPMFFIRSEVDIFNVSQPVLYVQPKGVIGVDPLSARHLGYLQQACKLISRYITESEEEKGKETSYESTCMESINAFETQAKRIFRSIVEDNDTPNTENSDLFSNYAEKSNSMERSASLYLNDGNRKDGRQRMEESGAFFHSDFFGGFLKGLTTCSSFNIYEDLQNRAAFDTEPRNEMKDSPTSQVSKSVDLTQLMLMTVRATSSDESNVHGSPNSRRLNRFKRDYAPFLSDNQLDLSSEVFIWQEYPQFFEKMYEYICLQKKGAESSDSSNDKGNSLLSAFSMLRYVVMAAMAVDNLEVSGHYAHYDASSISDTEESSNFHQNPSSNVHKKYQMSLVREDYIPLTDDIKERIEERRGAMELRDKQRSAPRNPGKAHFSSVDESNTLSEHANEENVQTEDNPKDDDLQYDSLPESVKNRILLTPYIKNQFKRSGFTRNPKQTKRPVVTAQDHYIIRTQERESTSDLGRSIFSTEEPSENPLYLSDSQQQGKSETQVGHSWQSCLDIASVYFPEIVDNSFASFATTPADRDKVAEVIDHITEALLRDILVSKQIDNETKSFLQQKAIHMKKRIAVPWVIEEENSEEGRDRTLEEDKRYPIPVNHEQIGLTGYSFYDDTIRVRQWVMKLEMESYRKRLRTNRVDSVPELHFDMSTYSTNAFYNPTRNDINILAGIMKPPFYHLKYTPASLYSTLGSILGHEMSHAFDANSVYFDKVGSLDYTWYSEKERNQYEQKEKCFVDQYKSRSTILGNTVNSRKTLGENMADNAGLQASWDALVSVVESEANPPFPNTKAFLQKKIDLAREFTMAYAQLWCSCATKEDEQIQIQLDEHSPAQVRVDRTLSNLYDRGSQEYVMHLAWNCTKKDTMINDERCFMW